MAISKVILDGVTQMDVTTDTVTAETLITGYTATKNDGTKINGAATAGGFEVGDILQSVRTDLGTDWALCNGDWYDPTEYPELAEVLPKNTRPKANPNVSSYQSGTVMEMHNGEWCLTSSSGSGFSSVQIYNIDGSLKATVTASSIGSGYKILGVEHNGTEYVVFCCNSSSAAQITVHETTNFSTYTLRATLTSSYNIYTTSSSGQSYAFFDGSYYAVVGMRNSSINYGMIIAAGSNHTYTSTGNTIYCYDGDYMCCCKDGNAHRIFHMQKSSDGYTTIKYINASGAETTAYSSYYHGGTGTLSQVSEFNDDYFVAYGYYVPAVVFFPKTLTGSPSKPSYTHMNNDIYGCFLDPSGDYLLCYYMSSTVQLTKIPTNVESPWSSGTPYITIDTGLTSSQWGGSGAIYSPQYVKYRSKDNALLSYGANTVVRSTFLPSASAAEYYYYIKVQ